MRFRTIEHTADIGMEVEADSLPDLFAGAALAMFSLMVDVEAVGQTTEKLIKLEASDLEELMFRWLNELVFFMSADRLVFSSFEVARVTERGIEAVVRGEPMDPAKHNLELEIKAVTYHELEVSSHGDGWFTRVIFDV
ncbi:MAG: archease [Candidatus Geothermincolia bacterium]